MVSVCLEDIVCEGILLGLGFMVVHSHHSGVFSTEERSGDSTPFDGRNRQTETQTQTERVTLEGAMASTDDAKDTDTQWEHFSSRSLDFLRARRTVRKFKAGAEVSDEDLRDAVAAGQRASTSSWIQGFSVMHIADEEVKRKLLAVPGLNQSQNHESGALLLFCADNRRHMIVSGAAGQPFSPNFESFLIAVIDASLFAERTVAAFEARGYGVCYCGAVRGELPEVDALLELPVGVFPLFALAVGVAEGARREQMVELRVAPLDTPENGGRWPPSEGREHLHAAPVDMFSRKPSWRSRAP